MPVVTLPDGSRRTIQPGATAADVARDIGPGLAKAAIGARLDGHTVDLSVPITADCKIDNAERAQGDRLSFYVTGPEPGKYWEDLCMGTHVPSTKRIGAYKLLSVAGAFWHGDATKQQLQRVYGTAFPNKKELDAHLSQIEEAKKRDHRKLGQELNLFVIDPLVGSGMVLWKPKGA